MAGLGEAGESIGGTEVMDEAEEAKFSISQDVAVQIWQKLKRDGAGFVVAIIVDAHHGEVLMQAYQDEEAFVKTLSSGLMHYYSRSRGVLWLKGETSGHFQHVKAIKVDCDADSLVYFVEQVGSACHTGTRSCFYRDISEL